MGSKLETKVTVIIQGLIYNNFIYTYENFYIVGYSLWGNSHVFASE